MEYKDISVPVAKRVRNLLSRMTIEEKIGQMMQLPANEPGNMDRLKTMHIGSYLHCTPEMMSILRKNAKKARLGIPVLFGIDAIHGHCFENDATVFPTQLGMASSWDAELMQKVGEVTAREVRASGIHWAFSPVLCVARDLRWGRVDETFGEDPWLNGELASAMIKGYQGNGDLSRPDAILACAKHYAGYGETAGGRDAYETDITRRKMLSLFLPPFERVVREGCGSLMVAYQAIDGTPCSADPWLLRALPKDSWGLDGFIVTDWDNIGNLHKKQMVAADMREATRLAILAGNDMIMNTPEFYSHALELVRTGEIDLALIDDSVSRILTIKFRLGLFDERRSPTPEHAKTVLGAEPHKALSYRASMESIVMLKNDGVLPLNPAQVKRIALVGPNADDIYAQLGDWSFRSKQLHMKDDTLHRDQSITPLEGFRALCEEYGIALDYVKGADTGDTCCDDLEKAAEAAARADIVIACVGDTLALYGEYHDRGMLDLTGKQQALLEAVKKSGTPLVTVLIAGKPLTIPWVKKNSNAVFAAFNPGPCGGRVIAEAVFGIINPQGKITVSFPVHVGQQPVHYMQYTGWHSENTGSFPGEAGYMDLPAEPLWVFGEGIGYAPFAYRNLAIKEQEIGPGDALEASVDISNTGDREGIEIVQLYLNDLYSSVTTPVKELKAYRRVSLNPGETKTVIFSIPYEELSLVNRDLKRVVEAGEFELMIGPSSRTGDLLLTRFTVSAS